MDNKILIISYDMIPNSYTWGSCQRMYYLASYLTKENYDVTVISSYKNTNNLFGNSITFKVKSLVFKNKFFNSTFNSSITNHNTKKENNKLESRQAFYKKILTFGKNCIKTSFGAIYRYIYNDSTGSLLGLRAKAWCYDSKEEVLDYIMQNNIKNVIITAPPFGIFTISRSIRAKFKDINIILDYRDPWNLWEWKKSSFLSRLMEKKTLNYASKIVCTNKYLADAMSKKFHIPLKKISVIANGYSEGNWEELVAKRTNIKELVITYVGYIDFFASGGYRDTTCLINAFERFIREHKNIILRFVGVKKEKDASVKKLKERFNENIEFVGVVENKEAYKYMIKSDVLLLLHTTDDDSSKYIISGKMYDYIKAEKPIFSIGSNEGIHSNMVDNETIGIHSENNEDEIYRTLQLIYSMWEKSELSKLISVEDKKIYSREYQYNKYLELLEK